MEIIWIIIKKNQNKTFETSRKSVGYVYLYSFTTWSCTEFACFQGKENTWLHRKTVAPPTWLNYYRFSFLYLAVMHSMLQSTFGFPSGDRRTGSIDLTHAINCFALANLWCTYSSLCCLFSFLFILCQCCGVPDRNVLHWPQSGRQSSWVDSLTCSYIRIGHLDPPSTPQADQCVSRFTQLCPLTWTRVEK